MKIYSRELSIASRGDFDAINITDRISEVVKESKVQEGSALVFYKHTTGAILVVEHEAGMLVDLEDMLERIAPELGEYKHHLRGYDSNGAAHIRTALLPVSLTVPIQEGTLAIGTYQEVIMLDMDPGEKTRTVLVQVTGA
jgi:secondary thiamine-phosphate synthase enzyme